METSLRDLQIAITEMLKDIIKICEKHKINYFLCAGSMLGAVRHKGMIPWDDDIDIGMVREEYEKFLKVIKQDLDSKYFFQSYETEPEYTLSFVKIRKNNTYIFEDSFHKNCNINKGLFIDIFVFDKLSANKLLQKIQIERIKLLDIIFKSTEKKIFYPKRFKIYYFRKYIFPVIKKLFFITKDKAYKKLNDVLQKYSYIKNPKYYSCFQIVQDNSEIYLAELFDEYIYVEFEGLKVKILKNYDKFLTTKYGDYMKLPPIEKQIYTHAVSFSLTSSDRK